MVTVAVVVLFLAASFAVLGGAATSPGSSPPPASVAPSTSPVLSSTTTSAPASAQSLAAQQFMSQVRNSTVPAKYLHLPNLNELGNTSLTPMNVVSPGYTAAPAPMGLAYYGIYNSTGGSLKAQVQRTTNLEGSITLTSAAGMYFDSTAADEFGIQLNAVTPNVTFGASGCTGTQHCSYWEQNVLDYQVNSSTLTFDDNIWNFTSSSATMPQTTILSSPCNPNAEWGTATGNELYYAPGPSFYAPFPLTLDLWLNSSLTSVNSGSYQVWFNYTLATNGHVYSGTYDCPIFNLHGKASAIQFEASGSQAASSGIVKDFEMDICGSFSGASYDFFGATGTIAINYWNTSGTAHWSSINSAYNFGSQTGETLSGLSISYTTPGVAVISAGPSFISGLWNVSGPSHQGSYTLTNSVIPSTTTAYKFIWFEPTATYTTGASATVYQWAPDVSSWQLLPGKYNYVVELDNYDLITGQVNVASGPSTLTGTMTFDMTRGIYAPLWAFSNAQLASISSSGSGTVSNPYLLFNNPTPNSGAGILYKLGYMDPRFGAYNDYYFPTFTGIFLVNTNAYVSINQPPTFNVNSTADSGLSITARTPNYLQMQFYGVSHVTLSNATKIFGWQSLVFLISATPAQNTVPQSDVWFWNSTNNLVMSNHFYAQARNGSSSYFAPENLLGFYGGNGVLGNNVVWGNNFTDPGGVALGTTYTGIQMAESGDTVFNNHFFVDDPVIAQFFDPYSEECPGTPYCTLWPYADAWNIANQSAANTMIVNGHPLTGSIAGGPYQGGNFWWNFGNFLNPFTASYVDTFNYTTMASDGYIAAATSASIYGTGDAVPLVPAIGANPGYLYRTTVNSLGPPGGGAWHITVSGTTTGSGWALSAKQTLYFTGSGNGYFVFPQGSYTVTIAGGPSGTNPSWNATGMPTTLTSASANTYSVYWQERWSTIASKATATGLPSATRWWVNYTGPITGSVTGTGNTLNVWLPNGTFGYTVQAHGYAATPGAGFFIVSAATSSPITVTHFTHIVFQATFSETGLLAGTTWSVTMNGTTPSTPAPGTLTFGSLPNGTYAFTVTSLAGYGALPRTGSLVVNGANAAQAIVFSTFTYTVTFSAPTLPGGTAWAVTLNGVLASSSSTTITFQEPNGTYSYAVALLSGTPYTITPSSGSVTVTHAPVSQTIVFSTPAIYALYFTENGLPSGTTWSVTVAGVGTSTQATATISFTGLTAASYSYTIGAITGYTANPSGGSPTIVAVSLSIAIVFTPVTYTVTFTETGLTGGTMWAVNFGGTIYWSSTATITILVGPGTYAWQIGNIPGKTPNTPTGSTTIVNTGASYTITFTTPP